MRRAVSTYVYVNQRLHPALLDTLARSGVDAIEVFGARQHFDYHSREQIKLLASWLGENPNVGFHSLHSPLYSDFEWGRAGEPPVNIADPEKKRRIESMDEIKRAIEVAELAPFKYLVQHVGVSGEESSERKLDAVLTSLEHLYAFAKPLGVKIALENIPNELSTPEALVELIRGSYLRDLVVCFDTGHAHMMGGVLPALETLKPLIHTTHVHDNEGREDNHLWPEDGTILWPDALEGLRTCPNAPPVLLEISGEGQEKISEKITQAFDRLQRAADKARED